MPDSADVVIVGGGPAGAALATRLASAGIQTMLVERSAQPSWRACGVFSSPLTRRRLAELGLSEAAIATLARPISALNLETTRGAACRIEYERGFAAGFDRPGLDVALLELARRAGAEVRTGAVAHSIELPARPGDRAWVRVSPTDTKWRGDWRVVKARLVVGADGSYSRVAATAGVARRPVGGIWKSGITFHRHDPDAAPEGEPMEGRFMFGRGWYVGVAPVPNQRVNVGIVHPARWLEASRPDTIARRVVASFRGSRAAWTAAATTDAVRVEGVLGHSVSRAAGDGFVLVGDAAGFIDPLTGEGLHRALVSSAMAAEAIGRALHGDRGALAVYDRRLRSRFLYKDIVSWVLQAFLAQPRLFDYALRRLATRGTQRRILTLVLTDQLPATRALDPRFLVRLLAP